MALLRQPSSKLLALRADHQHAGAAAMSNYRNEDLTRLAKGQACSLQIVGVCDGGTETTVWCHSPYALHGKGGSLKAHDFFGCFGCRACHDWLDGRTHAAVPRSEKFLAFRDGMEATIATMWMTGMIGVTKRTSTRQRSQEPPYTRPSKMLPR